MLLHDAFFLPSYIGRDRCQNEISWVIVDVALSFRCLFVWCSMTLQLHSVLWAILRVRSVYHSARVL